VLAKFFFHKTLLKENNKTPITVWSNGMFLVNHISETEMLSCYVIDMLFVKLVYDADKK
jgi:hypothetical protein